MHPRFVRVFSPPITAAAAAILTVGTLAATPAAAEISAYTTTSVNDRAGPGTEYPVLQTLPERTEITVYGCLQTLDWCDVDYQGRGWMSADYIQAYYQGSYYALNQVASYLQVPTVTFDIASYWNTFYRDQPFYQQMARYEGGNGGGYSGGNGGGGYSGGNGGGGQIEESEFYDRLSPYGDWSEVNGRYVWVPSHVSSDWRPYQEGRWVDTDQYGWMWVSDEPFGWATYHYGRWAYSNRVGWFWVPGRRWAPAWVAWRSSGSYLAWAPLPPEQDSGVSINVNININQVPDYYWDVVPSSEFLAANLSRAIIRDHRQAATYLQQTQPLGVVQVNGPRVVNNVLNVTQVENITKKTVIIHNVTEVQDPQTAGKVNGKTVQIYTPKPTTTTTAATGPAKPPKLVELTKVEQQSKTKGQAGNQPTTAELVQPLKKQLQQQGNQNQTNGQQQQNSTLSGKQQVCPAGTTLQSDGKCVVVQGPKNGKAAKLSNSSAGTPPPPPTSTTPLKTPPPKNGLSPNLAQPTSPTKTAICPNGETLQPNGKCASAQLQNNGKGTQLGNPSLGKNLKLNNTPPPPTNTTPLKTPPPPLKNGGSPDLGQPTSPSKTAICPSGEMLQPNGKCGTAQLHDNGKGNQFSKPSLGKNLKLDNNPPPPTNNIPSKTLNGISPNGGQPTPQGKLAHNPKELKQTKCPGGTVRQADGSCAAAPTNGKSQTMLKGPSGNQQLQTFSHKSDTPPPPKPTMVAPAHIQPPKGPNADMKTMGQTSGGNEKKPPEIKCPKGESPQPDGACGKGQ